MSTKINIRSPYYLDAVEPTPPSVALTCELIKLSGFGVDQFGNVDLPTTEYGQILSYTSTDSDFSDGKFDTVLTDTSRTVTFRISIPFNFTNAASDYIDCDVSATQPEFVCTGGVTTNGTIPNQSLNSDGNTVEIDLASYFTAGVLPISAYKITNSYPNFFTATISNGKLLISSNNIAGTETLFVEALDGDATTCNATQPIQVTITTTQVYDCTDTSLQGGIVNQDGSIINPIGNFDTITAIRTTPTGSPITSLPANNTGSFISYTLYFDITVPTGYTNVGATVQCPKDYTQVSSTLPLFDCDVASLTGQGIYTSGAILQGNVAKGVISSFSPSSFDTVNVNTSRAVTFNITPPSSGYSNSGGSDVSCVKSLTQPPIVEESRPSGSATIRYMNEPHVPYLLISQNPDPTNYNDSYEGQIKFGAGIPPNGTRVNVATSTGSPPNVYIGKGIWYGGTNSRPTKRLILTENVYIRLETSRFKKTTITNFVYYTTSGIISEFWSYYESTGQFIQRA